MSNVEDLICLKQQSIRDFLVSGGKVRSNQSIEFSFIETDPKKLCHPFRSVLHPDIKILSSLTDSMNALCVSRFKESDVTIKPSVIHHNDFANTKGVNTLAFDCEGLYFSSSGPGGIVRVYDFEESIVEIELRRGRDLQPIVTIDIRRGISHVCWSLDTPDELAVCFSFFPQIYIYNLNQNDYSSPVRILEVGRGGSEGGHNLALNWTKKQQLQSQSQSAKKASHSSSSYLKSAVHNHTLIAGSVKGYVRCWQSQRTPRQCLWNIIADPNQSVHTASSVVGLSILSDGDTLLTATESGVLVVWDIVRLQVAALGSSASPKCLHRICMYEQGLLNFPRVALVGFALRPPLRPTSSVEGQECETLLLTIGNGTVCMYDLHTDRPHQSTKSSFYLSGNGGGDRVFTSGLLPCYPDKPPLTAVTAFPHWPGGNACVIAHGSSLRVLDMNTNHREAALLRSAHFGQTPADRSEKFTQAGEVRGTHMRRTDEVCHTLSGRVITAENGCFQVVTSHDLQRYLCSEGVTQASSSRSSCLFLDWSHAEQTAGEDPICINGELVSGHLHTVDSVSSYAVMLREAYCGPSVRKGQPVVYLRTNLTPRGHGRASANGDGEVWPVLREMQLSFNCTGLLAHPTRPYLLGVGDDGGVHIMLPHSTSTVVEVVLDALQTADSTVLVVEDGVRLTRGNHFNVWRRSVVSGQLVSISIEDVEKKREEQGMSDELIQQLSDVEGAAGNGDETETPSVVVQNHAWLDDVVRDLGGGGKKQQQAVEMDSGAHKQQQEEVVVVEEVSVTVVTSDEGHTDSCDSTDPESCSSHNVSDCTAVMVEEESVNTDHYLHHNQHKQHQCEEDSFRHLAPLCIEDLMGIARPSAVKIIENEMNMNTNGEEEVQWWQGEGSEGNNTTIDSGSGSGSCSGSDKENTLLCGLNGEAVKPPVSSTTFSIFSTKPSNSAGGVSSKNKRPFSSTISAFTSSSGLSSKAAPLQQAQAVLARKHGVNSLSSRVGSNKTPAAVDVLATTCPTMFSAKPLVNGGASAHSSSASGGTVNFKSVMGEASRLFPSSKSGIVLKNVRNNSVAVTGTTSTSSTRPTTVRSSSTVKGRTGELSGLAGFLKKKK